MPGTEQTAFLTAESHKDKTPALAVLDSAEAACQLHHASRARAVVIGAVMDFLFLALRKAAEAAPTEVVVVGANDNSLLCQRTVAFKDTDNVLHGCLRPSDPSLQRYLPAA